VDGTRPADEPAEDSAFHREARFICRINVEEVFLMADNSGRDSDLRNVSSRDVVYNARRQPTKRTPEPPLPLFPLSPRRNLTFRPERLRLPQFAFFFDPPAAFRSRESSSLRGIFYLSLSATRLHPRVSFYISTPDTGNPCAGNQSECERMWDKSDCRPFAFSSERFRDSLFSHLQRPIRDDHPE